MGFGKGVKLKLKGDEHLILQKYLSENSLVGSNLTSLQIWRELVFLGRTREECDGRSKHKIRGR